MAQMTVLLNSRRFCSGTVVKVWLVYAVSA